eukprot:4495618-Amphidinium_carterae.6
MARPKLELCLWAAIEKGGRSEQGCLPQATKTPDYHIVGAHDCWKLKKALLYGLKEAPRILEVKCDADLSNLSFSCLLDGITLKLRLWQSRVHKSVRLIISEGDVGLIRQRLDALPVMKSSMEAYTGQEEMIELCLMDYMEGIPVYGLICVHVDDLGIGARLEVLNALSDALHEFFKGGRDSPLDPESFKGHPTEVTCDLKVLEQLEKKSVVHQIVPPHPEVPEGAE